MNKAATCGLALIFVIFYQAPLWAQVAPQEVPVTTAASPAPSPAALPSNGDEGFIQKFWGFEFGQCLMTQPQHEEYEKKWTRYRVLTRARYNILAKSYFGNKMPSKNPVEIDWSFQYQALEPMSCPGLTDENRTLAVQKALETSLAEESIKLDEFKKLFELDESPKKLEDFIDLFNDPAFISMPYSLQDGYDQLFKEDWDRTATKKDVDYTYTADGTSKTVKFSKDDMRSIDAIARTMWSELSACDNAGEGHFQMLARVIFDRVSACEKDPMVNRRHCRADAFGKKLSKYEQVVAAPVQFPAWSTSAYAPIDVTNTAGKKIGRTYKDFVGFRKLVRPNALFRKTLCPTQEDNYNPLSDQKMATLKKAYLVALEFYRDPKAFAERWKWPKSTTSGMRFYSYGVNADKGVPKSIRSIFDTSTSPAVEIDFKKTASAKCPTPNFYERR